MVIKFGVVFTQKELPQLRMEALLKYLIKLINNCSTS